MLLRCLLFLVLAIQVLSADEREYRSKTIYLEFDSAEEAREWSLRKLGFREWLKTVAHSDWIELFKKQTEEFYLAIFRSGDHLILCLNDLHDAYTGGSYSIRAKDEEIAYSVTNNPSKLTILKYEVDYPQGGYGGQEAFMTWKIEEGFSGELILNHKVKKEGGQYREILHQSLVWEFKNNF